jgi:hypothetical protein
MQNFGRGCFVYEDAGGGGVRTRAGTSAQTRRRPMRFRQAGRPRHHRPQGSRTTSMWSPAPANTSSRPRRRAAAAGFHPGLWRAAAAVGCGRVVVSAIEM